MTGFLLSMMIRIFRWGHWVRKDRSLTLLCPRSMASSWVQYFSGAMSLAVKRGSCLPLRVEKAVASVRMR